MKWWYEGAGDGEMNGNVNFLYAEIVSCLHLNWFVKQHLTRLSHKEGHANIYIHMNVCMCVCDRKNGSTNKRTVKKTTDSRLCAYKCVWELDLTSSFVTRCHSATLPLLVAMKSRTKMKMKMSLKNCDFYACEANCGGLRKWKVSSLTLMSIWRWVMSIRLLVGAHHFGVIMFVLTVALSERFFQASCFLSKTKADTCHENGSACMKLKSWDASKASGYKLNTWQLSRVHLNKYEVAVAVETLQIIGVKLVNTNGEAGYFCCSKLINTWLDE